MLNWFLISPRALINMSQDDEDIWQNGVKLEPDNDRGEAEDESYSPSSYIPKKVKVNRERRGKTVGKVKN